MKKVFIFTTIITLIVLGALGSARAYSPYTASGSNHFMRLDGRDANNRPVEAVVQTESSPFYNAYAMLSSFGRSRWQRSSTSSPLYLGAKKIFSVTLVAVPFIHTEIKRFLNHVKRLLTQSSPFFGISTVILFLLTVLIFESTFHTTREPRFRVPVFLE